MIIDIFQQNVVYIHERNNIMDTKKDRRIRKSKEALKNSLIELMKEKSVNNIKMPICYNLHVSFVHA